MKKWIIIPLFLFLTASINLIYPNQENPELIYIHLKSRGDYKEALRMLITWNDLIQDDALLEVNAYRIFELMKYPELIDEGIPALELLQIKAEALKSHSLRARTRILLNLLFLRKGDIKKSESIISELGYMGFHVLGPFAYASVDDFNMSLLPEREFNVKKMYQGKKCHIQWFYVAPDRIGSINFPRFATGVKNSLFLLYNEFTITKKGHYSIYFGRSGLTDISIDGEKILSNRTIHKYHPDQYTIPVVLNPGKHAILVKTGSDTDSLRFSLRITGKEGAAVFENKFSNVTVTDKNKISTADDTFFNPLQFYIKNAGKDAASSFRAGYLAYMAGIIHAKNIDYIKYLSAISSSHPYYSAANYYLSAIHDDNALKASYLNKSFSADNENFESLSRLVEIAIMHDHVYEAYEYIDKFALPDHGIPLYLQSITKLYKKFNWDHEAAKGIRLLKESIYPTMGNALGFALYASMREYSKAYGEIKRLTDHNYFSSALTDKLIATLLSMGKWKSAESVLHKAIHLHPDSVKHRILLARLLRNHHKPQDALPVLSSALRISPYNHHILQEIGYTYHLMGMSKIAGNFLYRAKDLNPDNEKLSLLLNLFYKKTDPLRKLLFDSPYSVFNKELLLHENEKAVILLNETAFIIESNGSYEKRIRRIIKVNKREAFTDFKNQYVIIDPKLESLESLKCVVINGGNTIEISDSVTKSLSDPDSRLYYDLKAIIVPIHALTENSIIDFSYILKNKGGDVYKNNFFKQIYLGNKYSTLKTNVIISAPSNLIIYNDLKNIVSKIDKKIHQTAYYHLSLNNISSYKPEQGMPHESVILPSVYFTTYPSWSSLCNWYISLFSDRLILSDEIRSSVDQLILPSDTPLEKIRKIYTHVINEIRYVGFEFGMGGIQPRRTDVTYHSKMGDCKDIALLLVVMLRYAGFDARLALVRTRSRGFPNIHIPTLEDFNHALCYVNVAGGFFLDGTVSDTDPRELPSEDRNVTALILDDSLGKQGAGKKSNYAFITTENSFYNKNYIEIINSIEIEKDGAVLINRRLSKHGSFASEARYSLKGPLQDKISALNEYWNKLFPGSAVSEYEVLNVSLNNPAEYQYTVHIPSYGSVINNFLIFEPYFIRSNYLQNYCLKNKRVFPINISIPSEIKTTTHIKIPEGYAIDKIPPQKEFQNNKLNASFRYSIHGDIITAESSIVINDFEINVKEYTQFKEFSRIIHESENAGIIFKKTEQ